MASFKDFEEMIQRLSGHDPASNNRRLKIISKIVLYLETIVNEIRENKKISRETLMETTLYIDAVRELDELKDLGEEIDGFFNYLKKRFTEENYEEIDEKNTQRLADHLAKLRAYEAYFSSVLVE